jgi:phosphohistidine phosphatase SixA
VPLVLDLLRHGEALADAGGGDASRRLSPAGERALERLAAHLAGQGWRPTRAFTSPLVRARESARIVLARTEPGLQAEVMQALRPDGEPAEVANALAEQGAIEGHVLLIGHQPLLGELGRHLAGGRAPALAPGDLVRIEFTGAFGRGTGTALWKLDPEECG